MIRRITCTRCAKWWQARTGRSEASEDGPAEDVRLVWGDVRGPYVCDDCNDTLKPGARAAAVSVSTDARPYSPWEHDYLGDTVTP